MKTPRLIAMAIATSLLAVAAVACAGSNDATPTPTPPPTAPPAMAEVLAPIESVEVLIAESFPPQYFLHVVSGLPNTCVTFGSYDMARDGSSIAVSVKNLEPTTNIVCGQLYGAVETHIALGSAFDSGETYTVAVNGVTENFVAQ